MAVAHRLDAGGHVGDAADRQHPHPEVGRHHRLGDGAHPHRVRPHGGEGAYLGGGLVAGAHKAHVDPLFVLDALFCGHPAGQIEQVMAEDLGHVGEAGAKPLVVRPDEGVCPHHVDGVGNQHQVPRGKAAVDAAGGVGQHHRLHPQQLKDIEGVADLLHGVALVEVEPPLHRQHRLRAQPPFQQRPLVALHRRLREVGDVRVGDLLCVGHTGGQVAEARPQHHRDLGRKAQPLFQPGGAGRRFFVQMFHIQNAPFPFFAFCFYYKRPPAFWQGLQKTRSVSKNSQDIHSLSHPNLL